VKSTPSDANTTTVINEGGQNVTTKISVEPASNITKVTKTVSKDKNREITE